LSEPKQRSFNPRARVGRDEKKAAAARENGSFNPRARVGRDIAAHDVVDDL